MQIKSTAFRSSSRTAPRRQIVRACIAVLLTAAAAGCGDSLSDLEVAGLGFTTDATSEPNLTAASLNQSKHTPGEFSKDADNLSSEGDTDQQTRSTNGANGAKFEPPYPNRTNPFAFAVAMAEAAGPELDDRNLDLKLYGFVGDGPQSAAIINIGGVTKTMKAGEKWGAAELMTVEPPMIRIRINGLVRSWSLIGKQP